VAETAEISESMDHAYDTLTELVTQVGLQLPSRTHDISGDWRSSRYWIIVLLVYVTADKFSSGLLVTNFKLKNEMI